MSTREHKRAQILAGKAVPAQELAGRSPAAVRRLAALGAEVDAIWQHPPEVGLIRSCMTLLKPPPEAGR